jgi:hypothetical protein
MKSKTITITIGDGIVRGGKSSVYKDKAKNGSADTGQDGNEKKDVKDTALYKMLHLGETAKEKMKAQMTPGQVMAVNMGTALVKQVAGSAFNYYANDIGRQNGDSNYQAIVNRKIEQIMDIANPLMAAAGGAVTGSIFGPMGALVGAVLSGASSLISTGFRQAERGREYQHQMFQEKNSQAASLARANYSVWTGRLR